MVMEATPAAALVMCEAELLLELLVVSFNTPAHLGHEDQLFQGGLAGRRAEKICLVGGIYGWFRSSGMVLLNDVMRRCRLIHRACLWTSRGAFHWHTRRLVHRCEALGG